MEKQWYYTRAGQQMGPVEWAELRALAVGCELAPGDHVWTDGFTEWKPASSVEDLFKPTASLTTAAAEPLPTASLAAATVAQIASVAQAASAVAANGFPGVAGLDYSAVADSYANDQFESAGFWIRFCASFVDGLIVALIWVALSMAFTWYIGADGVRENRQVVSGFLRLVLVVVGWLYCAMQESGTHRSTPGKRLFNITVTDMAGNQLSFMRASGRHFGKIISQVTLGIGYLMMLFTTNRQCLHDLMSGCVVLKQKWN
jgi:uncharacterized RDD family membrane protein YckC